MVYVGQNFGNLKVISLNAQYKQTKKCNSVECCCTCGIHVLVSITTLLNRELTCCDKCFNTKLGFTFKNRTVTNEIGQKFGHLHVIKRMPNYIKLRKVNGVTKAVRDIMWLCKCDCQAHNEVIIRGTNLRNKQTTSCGCVRSNAVLGLGMHDLSGQVFGYWTVLCFGKYMREPNGRQIILWRCQCRCGTVKLIRAGSLTGGTTKSCGCHKLIVLREKAKHGFGISQGERFVMNYLQNKNINYIFQKCFSQLLSNCGYPLSFDFYIPDNQLLIEYQGKQHYESIDYFGGFKRFKVQQQNDELKRLFAKNNNYKLIELPYWYSEFEIVYILDSYLNSNG